MLFSASDFKLGSGRLVNWRKCLLGASGFLWLFAWTEQQPLNGDTPKAAEIFLD